MRRAFPWARVYTSVTSGGKRRGNLRCIPRVGVDEGETIMATQPPPETPAPSTQPVQPDSPPPEVTPPGPDIDIPSPGMPAGDPGTSQPAEI